MRRTDFLAFHRLVSTCLGIGYIRKGGGTVAAGLCCIVWYVAGRGRNEHFWVPVVVMLAVLTLGVWSAGKVEAGWGLDSNRVVIDEVAGMCITLLFVPVKWPYVVTGFVLFRFFDIVKPMYIRKMEKLDGGWGVMMDDVLAGVYANAILQVFILFKRL